MTQQRSGIERVVDLLGRITGRGGRRSERTERALLVLAVVAFAVAAVLAWRQLPDLDEGVDLRWTVAVAVLGALALAVNAREFAFSARTLGSPVGAREALRVSALSSAANILPIPGAVAIRTRALLQGGARLRDAALATTAVGIAWVAAAALAAAVVAVVAGEPGLLAGFLAGGVGGVVLAVLLLRRAVPTLARRDLVELALVEALSVAVSGLRLWTVGLTFGFGVDLGQAVTVNLGGILSNVAGFLPGGLGLREVASGAFGVLVGVPVAVGVLLSAADRLAMYVVLAVVAGLVLARARQEGEAPGSMDDPAPSEGES